MNANELADELENKPLAYGDDIQEWLGEAATMLRQQQAEIEALKAHFNKENPVKEVFNTEPVAWMNFYDRNILDFDKGIADEFPNDWIPLYTHPAKTLTDEEIMDYVDAFSQQEGSVYVFQEDNILEMTHSILRKAQENG